MPTIHNLAETALFVADLPRARDFYQRVLGLETAEESASGCVLAVAEGQVLLLVAEEKARVPSRTPGGEVPPCRADPGEILGAGHVALGVAAAELDAWRARLESEGVEVLSEVVWERGARSLYFRDPDGHLLELVTPGLWGSGG